MGAASSQEKGIGLRETPPKGPKEDVRKVNATGTQAPAEGSKTEPSIAPVVGEELLTWGVELELVFAFKENLLQKTLDHPPTNAEPVAYDIVKNIPKRDRKWDASKEPPYQFTKISNEQLPNHAYNSWGLIPKADPQKRMTRYTDQPRLMLREKIRRHSQVRISSMAELSENQKVNDVYGEWRVSDDSTVPGVGSQKLRRWLPKGKFDPKDAVQENSNWDTFGLELISPVFDSDNSERAGGRATISAILNAVNTEEEDTHAFITNQCGLHVHVGDPKGFSLEELRVLAVLLLMYEEELSLLHPPIRRTHHRASRNNIETNRYGSQLEQNQKLRQDLQGPEYVANKRMLQKMDFSTASWQNHFPRLSNIMDWAKSKHSIKDLVHSFNWPPIGFDKENENGNRRRQVNFTPLIKKGEDFPKTIEFRGARGTLDDEEVFRFVDLCLGLVRLAKYYATHLSEFPASAFNEHLGPLNDWVYTRVNAFDLLHLMGTDQDGIKYWEGQKAKWEVVRSMSRSQRRNHVDDRSDLETTDDEDDKDWDSPPPAPKKRRAKRPGEVEPWSPSNNKRRFRRMGGSPTAPPSPSYMEENSFDASWSTTAATPNAGREDPIRPIPIQWNCLNTQLKTTPTPDNPFGGPPGVPGVRLGQSMTQGPGGTSTSNPSTGPRGATRNSNQTNPTRQPRTGQGLTTSTVTSGIQISAADLPQPSRRPRQGIISTPVMGFGAQIAATDIRQPREGIIATSVVTSRTQTTASNPSQQELIYSSEIEDSDNEPEEPSMTATSTRSKTRQSPGGILKNRTSSTPSGTSGSAESRSAKHRSSETEASKAGKGKRDKAVHFEEDNDDGSGAE